MKTMKNKNIRKLIVRMDNTVIKKQALYRKLIYILSTALRCSGYWPTTSSAATIFKILNVILRFLNFGILFGITAVQLGAAVKNFNDLSLVTDNLCFSIGCFEVAIKAFTFYDQYDNIIELINGIYVPFDKLHDMGNVEMITQLNSLARFELTQFAMITGLISLLVLARVFGADRGNKEFPIHAYFPFDSNLSPQYELLYIVITYGVFCVDFSLLVIDLMIVVLMRYLTFQLKILVANYSHCHFKSIENSKNDLSPSSDDDDQQEDIKNFVIFELYDQDIDKINTFDWRFKQCIIHHQKLIHMMTVLNNCFSFCVVIQIMGSIVLICLNGFQILLGHDDRHLILRRIMALMAVTSQLYLWCFYGNKMSTEADAVTYHQWMCGWENEFKRGMSNSVTTPMILSLRSLELRALGLVPLSLQTFVSAVKTSYSVLVLLLAVADD